MIGLSYFGVKNQSTIGLEPYVVRILSISVPYIICAIYVLFTIFGKGNAFHYRQLSLVGTSFLYHRVVLLRFVGRAIGLGEVFAFVQETDLEGAAGTAARSFAWRRGLPRRAIRRFENGDYIDAECS